LNEPIISDNNEFSAVNSKKMTELIALIEELVINKARIEKIKNEIKNNEYIKVLEQELRLTTQVQEVIKKMRMVKIKTVFSAIPEAVERYCKQYNKDVHLILEGEETEIENSIVGICESLLKLFIKNIIQNNFHISDEIKQSEKNANGNIKIKAFSDLRNLLLSIESNVTGFDFQNICKTLNRNSINLVHMSEKEIQNLLELTNYLPSFQDIISIKSSVAMMGGNIEILGEVNKIVQINISIPLSSSITKALLVNVTNQTFAIPLDYIQTIINRNSVKIKNSYNSELILYMKEAIPLIRVAHRLDLPQCNSDSSCILIVKANNKVAALLVDSLLDEVDVVIKPKPEVLDDIPEFRGTTILGDGNITLILDVPSLV
jgi:chemotaxis protein histidine kinase CheA